MQVSQTATTVTFTIEKTQLELAAIMAKYLETISPKETATVFTQLPTTEQPKSVIEHWEEIKDLPTTTTEENEETEEQTNVVQLVPPASEETTTETTEETTTETTEETTTETTEEEETTTEEEEEPRLDFNNINYKGISVGDKQRMREWLISTNSMNSSLVREMLTVDKLAHVPNYLGRHRCDTQAIKCAILRLKGYTSVYEKNGEYTIYGQNKEVLTNKENLITCKGAKGEIWERQSFNVSYKMFGEYLQACEIWAKVVEANSVVSAKE